ncbi:hypothetical protein [Nonlabens marinus]|uniref:Lipocalin-like domain-containing protein n=1 Tax=Nonlabens marinus S1-08 TaxID=1454201 RepID=W8VSK1_9FLAO|nr:hypothetical protein [Nonlabens marinus]BAO56270.1 hypothetical protein NMS_2261 [Nonlabens marinus S1-08]
MNKVILISLLAFITISCKQNKKDDLVEVLDCSSVKTGTFKYANEAYGEWIITRTDSTSIETSPSTEMKIYSTVNWISDCEYELHIEDVDKNDNMNVVNETLRVVITDVTDYGYKCISYTNDGPEEFEMIRI